jgi:arylsulfatase A-like enzyme
MSSERPNVIMITCHDIGQHLGCYGVETVDTENLDALAAKGVRFSNFYSSSAVCSPGRGSLHTGRYPQSNGLMGLTHAPWWWSMNEDERHTAAILGDAGYDTYLVGFNHIDPGNPGRLGYQHVLSTQRVPEDTVRETVALIQRAGDAEKPFFAKVGFSEVHRPFTHGSDTSKGVFIPPWMQDTTQVREDFAAFQATIRFFDQRVGEILDALEDSDIAKDTLVIMTSDHGIPYPGAKWSARKAGLEVPFILYQPGTALTGGRVYEDLMSNVDVLPTLLDRLGIDIPANIQGITFNPLLEGETEAGPRAEAFGQFTPHMKRDNDSRCVITDRYQLIWYFAQGRPVDYPVDVHPQRFAAHVERCATGARYRPFIQLYDLEKDPYELENVADDPANAEVVDNLMTRLAEWMAWVDDPILEGPLAMPYYKQAMDVLNQYRD